MPRPLGFTIALALSVAAAALFMLAAAPAVAAGPDLKSYPAPDFNNPAYHKKIHAKVGQAWVRPDVPPRAGSKAVVIVTILRDGSLLESRLHHRSGSDAWDQSAVAAVKKAAPFEPLPKTYARTSLEVHFHFEWN